MSIDIAISVVITTYNYEKIIKRTLESVYNQTFKYFDVVIIDDCSSDNTTDIIKEYIADKESFSLYINEKNMGVSLSRNKGIEIASGDYIAILDGDDLWHEEKLERQYEFLKNNNVDLTYCSYSYFTSDENDELLVYRTKPCATYKGLLKENYIGCSTVLIKSDVAKNNKFSPDIEHEDYAYWLNLLKMGYNLKGDTNAYVAYRYSKMGRSSVKSKALKNRFYILHKIEQLSLIQSLYFFVCYGFYALVKKYIRIFFKTRGKGS